ncbi:tail tape measure protein [Pelagerythrobacter marinus]|uniref:tail tape measure protein n=1 Tax=Pelagerythrobacter marinus TaxID=538382 RepID=UPI002036B071|nr:tail tape measure protein [Pelagerythrobacter marinus]USA39024.1 tail tape measure protein [Pelagerythrobacter marinus]WPZ06891.1 tail tape measure protein [Pelagerythrobacter marinus]
MDEIDELLVEVRAGTQGFAQDIAQMRTNLDTTLVDGFRDAGAVLERGLLSAVRRGALGFEDLKRTALAALDQIAARSLRLGLDSLLGGGPGGGVGGLGAVLGGLAGALFGLPGRATGGPVSPGRPYMVGERGPEMFVPTSAGRVEASPASSPPREVRVAIGITAPRGTPAPVALQRSSRQVASAVRRALIG